MGRRHHSAVAVQSEEVERKPETAMAGPFRAAGLCRTKTGWAVAVVEVDGDGKAISFEVGPSQAFPEPVAQQLVRRQMALNQETLRKYPWRP